MHEPLSSDSLNLLDGEWDAAWRLTTSGGEKYGEAGVRLLGNGLAQVAVKWKFVGPSMFKQFRDVDLPAIKARARELGAVQAVSTAGPDDKGFVRVTSAFGWREHSQMAVLDL